MQQIFCQGCENQVEYQNIHVENNQEYSQLTCQKCHEITCYVKCEKCNTFKFKKQKDVEMILNCKCGGKQRIFKCNQCQQFSTINNDELKQSSKITCGLCRNNLYVINCPECNKMSIQKTINEQIYCINCNLRFSIDECQFCKQDCFSKDDKSIQTFKCNRQHIFQKGKCEQCKHSIYLKGQNQDNNIQCQNCKINLNLITCLCGTQNLIKKSIDTYKCIKCQFQHQIDKCITNQCNGYMIDRIQEQILPIQGQYLMITKPYCLICKQTKFKINCLRCQNKKIVDKQQDIPTKCPQCLKEFVEIKQNICNICETYPINQVFIPCYHVFCCHECSVKVNNCPVCRQSIQKREKVYFS